jgi:hypothetical protein
MVYNCHGATPSPYKAGLDGQPTHDVAELVTVSDQRVVLAADAIRMHQVEKLLIRCVGVRSRWRRTNRGGRARYGNESCTEKHAPNACGC